MKEKRMLQNDRLRWAAMVEGLAVGSQVIIRERSLLKDGGYITRMIRRGTVCKLYPYHFYCQMENGRMESFRYNELLGWEARLIRIKGKNGNKKAPEKVLFLFIKKPPDCLGVRVSFSGVIMKNLHVIIGLRLPTAKRITWRNVK